MIAGLLAIALPGCKTSGTLDTVATGTVTPPGATGAVSATPSVIGTGPFAIAIFTDSVNAPQLAADQRDGAALAVNRLAKDQITLTVYDTGASGPDIGSAVQAAIAAGAKLLIGPPSLIASPVWAKIPSAKRPPAIVLATAPQKPVENALWLVSSETDSAAEIVGYAANAGKKQVLVAAPAPLTLVELAQIKGAVEMQGGTFLGIVIVPSQMLDRELLARADAVLLYGSAPTAMLTPLHQAGLRTEAWILGTSAWAKTAYIGGAYFAAIDQNGFRHISGSFQTSYARGLTEEAAYAFDAVAVAAGIVRAKGSVSPEELKSQIGFSGATGPFRFHNDGHVQRRFSVYKVEGAIAKLHEAAPAGF